MGMINVLKHYFELLRIKYFNENDSYEKDIDYEDLSNCFVYPAKAIQYFGQLGQTTIDMIYEASKTSANAAISGHYCNVVRVGT